MTDVVRTRTERFYRRLLYLYPAEFRERFTAELLDVFRDKYRAAGTTGRLAIVVFWFRIVRDVVVSAAGERLAPPRPRRAPRGEIMQGFLHDVRYAIRVMARRPSLSLVIVITLALGIGANTAIFSLVNTVLLRPLPYADAERLVMVWEQQLQRGNFDMPVRPANFFDWKARSASFEDVAWSRDAMYNITGDGDPESVLGYRFSANMLDVLGVQPAIGRGFRADEDKPGAPRVALLSHALWQRRYAVDPSVLGRVITMNGESFTVVGVMPAAFKHPQGVEIWTPIALTPELAARRDARFLRLVGRLKPGVSRERAQAELTSIYGALASEHPAQNAGITPRVAQLGDPGDAKPLLAILFASVGFVLLIACVNVANLLLAEVTSRRRELAVRSALGASRLRVARQMLTESVILALTGGLLGALLTWWTSDALTTLFPRNISNLNLPLVERVDVGVGVFLFALVISIATGLLFGVLPAWNVARASLQGALKDGDRGGSVSHRTHATLVVAEVAFSIVLLAGALLMAQSFVQLQQQQLGIDTSRVLSARMVLPQYRYPEDTQVIAFTRSLVERLQAIPGVEQVGVTNYLPLSGWWGSRSFLIEGRPEPAPGSELTADARLASEDYFKTMGIPLLRGRTFTGRDDASAPPVVVVNETLARQSFPGEDPVGRRILIGGRDARISLEVVGVVGDVKSFGLEEETHAEMFRPFWQDPSSLLGITLRSGLDPASLSAQLRQAVWSIDRDQPLTHVLPMAQLAAESLAFRRTGMLLAVGFGALALILAAIGIYGVLSYSVGKRTREIGVRVALGAARRQVIGLVLREAMTMTVIGIGIGMVAALALTRFLGSLLFGVRTNDPATFAAVGLVLLAVALVATWLPVRRATAVDPIVALRVE